MEPTCKQPGQPGRNLKWIKRWTLGHCSATGSVPINMYSQFTHPPGKPKFPQEQSQIPSFGSGYQCDNSVPYLDILVETVRLIRILMLHATYVYQTLLAFCRLVCTWYFRAHNPNARVFLYQTWGYPHGDPGNGHPDYESMQVMIPQFHTNPNLSIVCLFDHHLLMWRRTPWRCLTTHTPALICQRRSFLWEKSSGGENSKTTRLINVKEKPTKKQPLLVHNYQLLA